MKYRPILFNTEMVRAILEDRKTETRRIIKPQPVIWPGHDGDNCTWKDKLESRLNFILKEKMFDPFCPYGQVGDRLWVRETWADTNGENGPMISYRAGGDRFLIEESYPVDYSLYPKCQFTMWCGDLRRGADGHKWRPSIFMPRWASRITLEITEIKVERVQDITDTGALAEGVDQTNTSIPGYAKTRFQNLWDSINKKRGFGWDLNPWVWVVKFRRIDS